MNPLFVDYETRGTLDLPKVGAHEYLDHPDTQILMVGVAYAEGEPDVWPRLGARAEPIVSWGPFDALVYRLKEDEEPGYWIDAQALALYCGLPKSLEAFCRSVGIEAKKDARGTRLINLYSKPQEDGTFRALEGEDLLAFRQYCLQDVKLLPQAWKILEPLYPEWAETQGPNYRTVAKMNAKGVPIDREAVEAALVYIKAQETNLAFEFKDKTGLSVSQTAAITEYFGLPDVRRETLLKARFDDPDMERAREIRLQLSNATVKKLKPMLEASALTGRVRGCFVSNGAHTGRCTSHLVQFQNLKRGKVDEGYFAALYNWREPADPMGEAQSNIRGFIKPGPNLSFAVADYAQVEVRVLAWMSEDPELNSIFRQGGDPYKNVINTKFGVPIEEVADDQRQLGKVILLGCPYGVSGPGLQGQAEKNYGVVRPVKFWWDTINWYKQTMVNVPEMWQQFNSGLSWLMRGVVESFTSGRCDFRLNKSRKALVVTLPSGRKLRYMFPALEDGQVTYTTRLGVNTTRKRLWGGHVTENLCQAIAADLKFDVMGSFADDLIAEVHDEIILEVPTEDAEKRLKDLIDKMEDPPEWFTDRDLIKAEGKIMGRYSK